MMTVNEVSKLTGVSIRALQYYDKIGLLHPAEYTEAGYLLPLFFCFRSVFIHLCRIKCRKVHIRSSNLF